MNKVKCPKCRKILFRYKANIESGSFLLNMECPDCKSIVEIDLTTEVEHNSKKKLKDESELEIQE